MKAPKKSRSAYNFFCMGKRRGATTAASWRALVDRSQYEAMAAQDKVRATREFAEYEAKMRQARLSASNFITKTMGLVVGSDVKVLVSTQWRDATIVRLDTQKPSVALCVEGGSIVLEGVDEMSARLCPKEAVVEDKRYGRTFRLGINVSANLMRALCESRSTTVRYTAASNQQTYEVAFSGVRSVDQLFTQRNTSTGVVHSLSWCSWPTRLHAALQSLMPNGYTVSTAAAKAAEWTRDVGKKPLCVFEAGTDTLATQVLKRKRDDYVAAGVGAKIQKCYHGSKATNAKSLGVWGGLRDLCGQANGHHFGRGFYVATVTDPAVHTAGVTLWSHYATPTVVAGRSVQMVVQYDGLVGERTYRSTHDEREPKAGFVTMGNNSETLPVQGKKSDVRVFSPSIMNTNLMPTSIAFFNHVHNH